MQEKKLNRRLDIGKPARIKQVSYPQLFPWSSFTRLLRIVGGLLLAATLLMPVFWIPSLVILVLPMELYLLDWVHSQYTKSHAKRSLFDLSIGSKVYYSDAERRRAALRMSEAKKRNTALRWSRQPPFIRQSTKLVLDGSSWLPFSYFYVQTHGL